MYLTYLSDIVKQDLFSIKILNDDTLLRKALYMDLSRCWSRYGGAEITKRIHADWSSESRDQEMRTRLERNLVHGAVCDCGVLRSPIRLKGTETRMCRGGCDTIENLDHVILDCPHYNVQRSMIRTPCS